MQQEDSNCARISSIRDVGKNQNAKIWSKIAAFAEASNCFRKFTWILSPLLQFSLSVWIISQQSE